MNGIDEIISRIEAESAEAEKVMRVEFEQKKKQITDARDEKLAKVEADAKALAEAERKASRERAGNRAATVRRDEILTAKRELADSVFVRAADEFSKMDRDRYLSVMGKMLKEAFGDDAIKRGSAILIVPESAPATGEELVKAAGVALNNIQKSSALKAGFIIRTETVELNCTPQKLIDSRREALLPLVTAVLFG